jgi:hypothetical protein
VSALASKNPEVALIEDIASLTHNPLAYARYAFPWGEGELRGHTGPREWQEGVLGDIAAHLSNPETRHQPCQVAVASGHGIGKSALIAMLISWGMSTCEDCKIVLTANTEPQLRTKTWPEASKWARLAINSHWFTLTSTSLYSTDAGHEKSWRADAVTWSKENTEAFAGLHNVGKRIIVIFDEASSIDDKVWEVTEGALTDENTEILWIAFGNPTRNTGRFRECFRKFKHRWITRQIDSRTVEGTNKTQIAKWVDDYGVDSDFVKIRVRGIFPSMSAKQYISEDDVNAAYGRHLREEQYAWAPVILTCDPAWEGDDELVISKRQGLMFKILKRMPKNDNDIWVANEIARLEVEHRADAVFIDGGYGTGIVSAGRTLGKDWQLVWFSEKSHDPGCINKRAEMYQSSKKWFKEGGAIEEDPQLRDEAMQAETVARMDGKLQIESKKDMKSRGLPSPNRFDSLILSFAYPVTERKPRDEAGHLLLIQGHNDGRAVTDYDPFNR